MFGLIFTAILLLFVGWFALEFSYAVLGLDLVPSLEIKATVADVKPTLWSVIGGLIIFGIGVLILGTFALHNFYVVKRRISDRLYLSAGRPVASIEGTPSFEPDSECGYTGIQVEELYFKFDDCWLNVNYPDFEKLERAGGAMRIWFIPTEMRSWHQPRTGKLIKYNCTLVSADWRPLL